MDTQSETGPGSPADAGGVIIADDDASRVIVLDDQFEFPALLDAAKACRRTGGRLKLIDAGKLPPSELEWLGEAGADLYTSDLARQELHDFVRMSSAARKGGAAAAYFHHGPFEPAAEIKRAVSFESLKEMGRSGVLLHLSNGRRKRDFSALEELAHACVCGGTRLVYYHHDLLDPALAGLARLGPWIHVAGAALQKEDDVVFLCDLARTARERQGNLILHVENALALSWIHDIFAVGAVVLFQTPPSDYRSPQKSFERQAERTAPDPRSYYLYAAFML